MRVTGARVAVSADQLESLDLSITGGRIRFAASGSLRGEGAIDLTGCLVLPGLINAHDHLEFALFPKLGARLYRNATEWASDIYRPDLPPVREHRSVPKAVRLRWGGIRNLLSGVTTVSHHNPWDPVFEADFPVRVVREFDWAHSLSATAPDASRKAGRPFIIHAAEGTDESARAEIFELDALGMLGPDTVVVHALGADPAGIELLRERGCSIVWCPNSNLTTYGRTLGMEALRSGVGIALGSDSAITAQGDLRSDIVTARRLGVPDGEIYRMVTQTASEVLQLRGGEGSIREGGLADLIALRDIGQSPSRAICDVIPEVVIVGGILKLISDRLADTTPDALIPALQRIWVDSVSAGLIAEDVRGLIGEAESRIGGSCQLAGKLVTC